LKLETGLNRYTIKGDEFKTQEFIHA
jgi:hypothetical protein